MQAAMMSAGVAPELNLMDLLCPGNEACKQGNRHRHKARDRHHQKSKTGVSVVPQNGLMSPKMFENIPV